MVRFDIMLDEITYSCLINELSKEGKLLEAIDLAIDYGKELWSTFYMMKWWENVLLQIFFFNVRWDGKYAIIGKKGKLDKVVEMFIVNAQKGLMSCNIIYNIVIDRYCKQGNLEECFSLHNEMIQHGLIHNVVIIDVLFNGLRKMGNMQQSMELL